MGWLKKKFRQLKKKVKKILSTPWGRILGMVGMYFAMGAATKALSGWWNSLGQAGTQAGTQAATQVAEIAEVAESGSLVSKEAVAQGFKDKATFLNDLNTSAKGLPTNLLTGSNQAAANSAFSAFDTNSIGNYFSGNTEALNLSNSITDTVSQNLAQLKNPQTINVQDRVLLLIKEK